ncbi:MAG: hypothetical protein Q9164_000750 [Protoblastenia rupestris]
MVTIGYGIGLLNAWSVLWAATLVIFNDARGEFRRIEGRRMEDKGREEEALRETNGYVEEDGDNFIRDSGLRKRHLINVAENLKEPRDPSSSTQIVYHWQTLPPGFLDRLDWVADLICSFRAPRWAHAISGLAPPPPTVQRSLEDPNLPAPTPYSSITRQQLLKRNLPQLILCYFAIDGLKTLTMQDPYFWSLGPNSPSPFPFPRFTRLLLSATFTYISLQSIFLLAPLVFACLLGPERIGQHAWPWLYAPFFGSPRSVSRKGLAGVWGQWWQQLFRLGFEQAGEASAQCFGSGWGKKTKKGALLRVTVAFGCSGVLHACASYATLGHSKPMRGSFAFFMVQPIGLLGQKAASGWMKKTGLREKLPEVVRQVGNVLCVIIWFHLTGPLIADDFAATGIWLYEPVAVSLSRGLTGEGWWWWSGKWVRWNQAERWWQSGLAF